MSIEQLRSANTSAIKTDLYGYLEYVPQEVAGLLATLEAGKIDGSTYDGPCACLAGTCERIAAQSGLVGEPLIDLRDSGSLREQWFLAIREGDTPVNNPVAAITAEWLREWLAAHPQSAQQQAEGATA